MRLKASIERAGGLASANDLSKDWGLSRQRLSVLTKQEGFPEPVASVNGNPVWLGNEAREWRDKQTNGKKS